ncbi:MAG TPA: NAD(P)-dependent oxidoreductase, partial [Pyrinomonadaceae bacterium]|nr:NAD(P)-dependent oxidoreductase [Pyrinomonadaceae bacterium]
MASRQPPFPELTRALLDRATAARFDFGEDTALVTVQHMLAQTVDLLRTVCDLGLPAENIFVAGKVYSDNVGIIESVRQLGVTVVDSTMPEPGEFEHYYQRDVDRLWQIAVEKLADRSIKRVLVLDDGGTCIASVPFEVLRRYAVCGVEQTSQGIFLLEERPLRFPVFSWARTAVKLEIGSGIFSRCFIDKMNTEFLHGQSLQGTQLGIIGLGSIGKSIATLAVRQKAYVFFYDTNPDLHLPRFLRRPIDRVDSLEQLMMCCDYVVGCSGRNPFKDQWPLNYRPGLKLLSCSGGDQEFAPIIRDLKTRLGFESDSDSWDLTSEYGPSGPIRIAYRGYPYTFVSRGIEAVETKVVQLETGGLLAGL